MPTQRRGLKAPQSPVYGLKECKNPACGESFKPKNKDHLYHTTTCKNSFHRLARQEGERKLLSDYDATYHKTKETSKASVLRYLINHYPKAKNHSVEHAPSKHGMSGTRTLRRLKADELVTYDFDKKTNFYHIYTSKAKLKQAYIAELQRGKYGRKV